MLKYSHKQLHEFLIDIEDSNDVQIYGPSV
jgi:hypothetical protein